MTADRLFKRLQPGSSYISNFLFKPSLHLPETGLKDLYFSLICHDILRLS